MTIDYDIFDLGTVKFQSGKSLPNTRLAYKTYGQLNSRRDNVVVLPTFYTGTHHRNEGFFGRGRAIDPAKHFIVSINMFGNGLSSSPSNTRAPYNGSSFPQVSIIDNVTCQYRLLTERLKVNHIALVTGWSMAGCQSYQWAVQYPNFVTAILPFCASARTSVHNHVFLEGVKAALLADPSFDNGNYTDQPKKGLRAFGRVYAGWAYSQSFYRQALYKNLGFNNAEELLVDWESDHLNWDANNLLTKLWTWQQNDISIDSSDKYSFYKTLKSIRAKTKIIACRSDLYFPPEDNEIEAAHIPHAEFSVYNSPWGHCVASPGNEPRFHQFLDRCIQNLLGT